MNVESHAQENSEARLQSIFSTTAEKGNFYAQVRLAKGETFADVKQTVDHGYLIINPRNETVLPFFQAENQNGAKIRSIHSTLTQTNKAGFRDTFKNAKDLQLVHIANVDGNGASILSLEYKFSPKRQQIRGSERGGKNFFMLAVHQDDAKYLVDAFNQNPNETFDILLNSLDPALNAQGVTNGSMIGDHLEFTSLQSARIEIPTGKDITSVDPSTITPRG